MRREPDERYHATVASPVEPSNQHEALLWRCIRNLEVSDEMTRALEIYGDLFERERLQPWIIAGAEDQDIAERNFANPIVISIYRHLCFNPTVFRDRFELQRWVNQYDRRPNTTPEGAMFLKRAVLHGVEAVAHLMGAPVKLNPTNVLEQAMQNTHFRSLSLRDARLTSNEASVAHQLSRSAVDVAEHLSRTKPPEIGDILMKLKHRELTQSIEVVNATGEILH